jgi:hypothetical protein
MKKYRKNGNNQDDIIFTYGSKSTPKNRNLRTRTEQTHEKRITTRTCSSKFCGTTLEIGGQFNMSIMKYNRSEELLHLQWLTISLFLSFSISSNFSYSVDLPIIVTELLTHIKRISAYLTLRYLLQTQRVPDIGDLNKIAILQRRLHIRTAEPSKLMA